MRVIQSKFTKKQTRNFFQKRGGGAPGPPVLDPPLDTLKVYLTEWFCIDFSGLPPPFFSNYKVKLRHTVFKDM